MNKNNIEIKIGVIGAGQWGRNIIKTLSALGVLAAIVEQNDELQAQMAEEYPDAWVYGDVQHLLADDEIDGVVIATPAITHVDLAIQAISAHKHVFVEKPLAIPGQNLSELQSLVSNSEKILMVGHLLLYQPAITFIKSFLDAGKLGKVVSFHQVRRNLGTVREHENALYSLGVHDVAVLHYLIGAKPSQCRAIGQCVIQPGVEDEVVVHLDYNAQLQAHMTFSWLWPVKQRELMILGERGALHFDELTQTVTLHKNSVMSGEKIERGSEVVYQGKGQALTLELAHFIDCIITGNNPNSDLAQGVAVCEILESIQRQLVSEHQKISEPSDSHC